MTVKKQVDIVVKGRAAGAIREMKQLGTETDKVERSVKGIETASETAGGAAKKFVAGFAGIAGVSAMVSLIADEIDRIATTSAEVAKAMAQLQALNPQFAQQEADIVRQQAIVGGRGVSETARARHDLLSATSSLTRSQQNAMFEQVVEAGKLSPEVSLSAIGGVFGKASEISGITDFNALQNVLQATQQEGALDFRSLSRFFPRVLGTLGGTGASFFEQAGLFAAASKVTGTPEEAVTTIRAFQRGLLDPRKREALGITTKNPIEAIAQLQARGELSPEDAKLIAESEGLAGISALVNQPGLLQESIAAIREAETADDLVAEQFDILMEDPLFREALRLRQEQARAEGLDIDPDVLRNRRVRLEIENIAREQGTGVISRGVGRFVSRGAEILGLPTPVQEFGQQLFTNRGAGIVVEGDGAVINQQNISAPDIDDARQLSTEADETGNIPVPQE